LRSGSLLAAKSRNSATLGTRPKTSKYTRRHHSPSDAVAEGVTLLSVHTCRICWLMNFTCGMRSAGSSGEFSSDLARGADQTTWAQQKMRQNAANTAIFSITFCVERIDNPKPKVAQIRGTAYCP